MLADRVARLTQQRDRAIRELETVSRKLQEKKQGGTHDQRDQPTAPAR